MRNLLTAAVVLGSLVAFTAPSQATLITFDDLSDNGNGTQIPNGYQGLNWSNLYVLNTQLFSTPSGYQNNTVSPPNVVFNGFGAPAVISNNAFTLNSFYLGAAWNDGLQVTVIGKLNGVTLDTATFTANTSGPASIGNPELVRDERARLLLSRRGLPRLLRQWDAVCARQFVH